MCAQLRGLRIFGLRLGTRDIGDNVLSICVLLEEIGADSASAKHHDTINQIEYLPHVVADQDQRLALLLQGLDDILHLFGFLHTQVPQLARP